MAEIARLSYLSKIPAIRRTNRWFGISIGGGLLLCLASVGLELSGWSKPLGSWSALFPAFGAFAPHFLAMFFVFRAHRRIIGAFQLHRGQLCTNCLHGLAGLGERGPCPECQYPFDAAQDTVEWRRAGLRLKAPASPEPYPAPPKP